MGASINRGHAHLSSGTVILKNYIQHNQVNLSALSHDINSISVLTEVTTYISDLLCYVTKCQILQSMMKIKKTANSSNTSQQVKIIEINIYYIFLKTLENA